MFKDWKGCLGDVSDLWVVWFNTWAALIKSVEGVLVQGLFGMLSFFIFWWGMCLFKVKENNEYYL